ncbi:MAG TPA: Crp/Fnr family transcriptional regulator [Methylobacterium sp.]|jgi:CRP-like cAMP-binding protein|nr:Crp/Fnr family transcriptional regulator [Methylobacterium sp.]
MRDLQSIIAVSPLRRAAAELPTRNPLIRKLEGFGGLSEADRAVLERLSADVRTVDPHVDLIREGEVPDEAVLMVDGFAGRYKLRQTGSRQIMNYLLPGDLCDVDAPYLGRMDHAVGTLSTAAVVRIPRGILGEVIQQHPAIARALRLAKLAEEATAREWLVNLGTRSALERLAHLFCEVLARLEAVGLARQDSCRLPISQIDLADTLGLSNVHVNRVLQELRRQGLLEFHGRNLKILDLGRVRDIAEFSTTYLQPGLSQPERILA